MEQIIKVHVSKMTGKLEGFKSISSDTVGNKFCHERHFGSRNTEGLTIKKYGKYTYFKNLILICKKNPHTNFALWTKRTDVVIPYLNENEKPDNLILIYSNPKTNHILRKVPRHFDKVFNNVSKDLHKDEQNCTGQKCNTCFLCYEKDTTSIIVEAVKHSKDVPDDICKVCYSQQMLSTFRKNCRPALQRNEALAERELREEEIPTFLDRYFRFSAHGELITETVAVN